MDSRLAAALAVVALVATGCGEGDGPLLAESEAQRLPLDLGALNGLCTESAREWRGPRFQRDRVRLLAQARALGEAVERSPGARVEATFTEAHSGGDESVTWTVERLAREQLALADAADTCASRATPASARRAGATALNRLRTAVG